MSCGLSPNAWIIARRLPSGENLAARTTPCVGGISACTCILIVPGSCQCQLATVRAVLERLAVASLVSNYLLDRSLVRVKVKNGICARTITLSGENERSSIRRPLRVPVTYLVSVCDIADREFCKIQEVEVRLLVPLNILRVKEKPTVWRWLLKKGSLVAYC